VFLFFSLECLIPMLLCLHVLDLHPFFSWLAFKVLWSILGASCFGTTLHLNKQA